MGEKNQLDINKVNVEELYTQKGTFTTETGKEIPFTTATIKFTIGTYPLIFTAKVNKLVKEYLMEAFENA